MSVAVAPRMNLVHGGRALAVAVVAEVAGTTASPDHAIAIALISVVGGFLAMLVQIVVKDWLTNRRPKALPPKHPDHDEEQAALNQIMLGQMVQLQRENDRLEAENDRLRRKGQR